MQPRLAQPRLHATPSSATPSAQPRLTQPRRRPTPSQRNPVVAQPRLAQPLCRYDCVVYFSKLPKLANSATNIANSATIMKILQCVKKRSDLQIKSVICKCRILQGLTYLGVSNH